MAEDPTNAILSAALKGALLGAILFGMLFGGMLFGRALVGDRVDLDGYCYGVVDARGGVHPSEEPATVTQYGTIARTPEQVYYVIDPLYIIVDHECICENDLEEGVCDENKD